MFFINPYFQQKILTSSQKQKNILKIQSILLIPKYERKDQDKKLLYQYFINNKSLKQIQRSKSLRARILCVGEIQLITDEVYIQSRLQIQKKTDNNQKSNFNQSKDQSKYIILQKFHHDSTIATLNKETKENILNQNQQEIKMQMVQLKSYSFLKKFQYHQLLYLAHHFKKVDQNAVKYKQLLIKQNQPAQYVYFIQQGEFQVMKNISFQKQKSLSKNKIDKNKSSIKKYLQHNQSPYKVKQIKIIKEQISKIEGGSGQCFGQLQYFLQKQRRQYSLRCNSLKLKISKIHFTYFNQIFKYNQEKFNLLKRQYKAKHQNYLEKISIKKYLKNGIISIHNSYNMQRDQIKRQQNQKLSEIISSMEKYKTLENQYMQEQFTLPNNKIALTIKVEQDHKHRNRSKKLYSQNTKKNRYESGFSQQIKTSNNQNRKISQFDNLSLEVSFFPVISTNQKKKSEPQNKNNKSGINISKRRNKVRGLIDIDTIIKEKAQLLNSKLRMKNPQFSFYKIDQKNEKLMKLQKLNNKKLQKNTMSPVHSNQFMKNLVKLSLKKSGYLPQNSLLRNENYKSLGTVENLKCYQKLNGSSFFNHNLYETNISTSNCDQENSPSLNSKRLIRSLANNNFDIFFHKI